jgi:hypothetical protein
MLVPPNRDAEIVNAGRDLALGSVAANEFETTRKQE